MSDETVLASVHRDGHAGMVSSDSTTDERVRALHDLTRRAGIQGWSLKRLPLGEAVERYVRGLDCPGCALVLPCGCTVMRALYRQCPHGSAERIHQIAHEVGYCSNDSPQHQGPPL